MTADCTLPNFLAAAENEPVSTVVTNEMSCSRANISVIVMPLATMLSDREASSLVVVGVGLSIYAVVWNNFCHRTFGCMVLRDKFNRRPSS